jgi:competence protein ComEC
MRKDFIFIALASFMLALIALDQYFSFNDKKLHIVFCDVGQGDAIFIRTAASKDILIDGGPDKKVLDCLSRHMPFWDRELDVVIMTHPDADHLVGLIDVLRRYDVNGFYANHASSETDMYELLKLVLAEKKLSAKNSQENDLFSDDSGFTLRTLSPTSEMLEQANHNASNIDHNELSIVQLLTYGRFSVLFTGDAEAKVQERLAGRVGDIDILKLPHHGSADGITPSSLKSNNPSIAIISSGKGNRYGHPAKSTMELLAGRGIRSLNTAEIGDIELVSDGNVWYFAN